MTGAGRSSAALVLALLACESPDAPGTPPPSTIPPSPAANACAPARQLAGDWFYLADVMGGNSCPVFLEQDECVLAIFNDCTDRATNRQWLGRISAEGDVTLVAQRPSSSPGPFCSTRLDADEPNVSRLGFRCATSSAQVSSQIVLERRVDPMPELGTTDRDLVVYPFTSGPFASYDYYMFDVAPVEVAGRHELWFTVDDDREIDAGLYVVDQDTRALVSVIPMPGARLVTQSGAFVLGASPHAVMKVDAAARTPLAVAPLDGMLETTALAPLLSDDRVLVAFDPGMPKLIAVLRSFAISDLSPQGETRELPVNLINTMVAIPAEPDGTVAIVFGFDAEAGRGLALGIDAELRLTRTHDLPFDVFSAHYLPERGRIGAVAGNRYIELDPSDLAAPIRMVVGVPYTEAGQDFAYDAVRNRVYFLGRSFLTDAPMRPYHLRPSLLTFIDLAKEEAVPEAQVILALTRRVLVLPTQDAVIVAQQRLGTAVWVRP